MLDWLTRYLFVRYRISPGSVVLFIIAVGTLLYLRREVPLEDRLDWLNSRVDEIQSQNDELAEAEVQSENDELTEATFKGKAQDDPSLVNYIRKYEILPPSDLPYNLSEPERRDFSQYQQCEYAEQHFLHGMTDGFFLEAGALNGERFSNSLYFEKYKGWKGLLVEPDPTYFGHLVTLHRKAYAINAGFSLGDKSATANYVPRRGLGRIRNGAIDGVTIRTFPLYSMLLALGITQVDFFSLDIEGAEKAVLDTIPWNKVKFRLICIEINKFKGGRSAYVRYFQDRGFTFLGTHHIDAWFGQRDLLQETMDVDAWLAECQTCHVR